MIHVGINAKHKYPSGQAPGLTVIRCILVQSVTYFEAIKTKLMTNIHIKVHTYSNMFENEHELVSDFQSCRRHMFKPLVEYYLE